MTEIEISYWRRTCDWPVNHEQLTVVLDASSQVLCETEKIQIKFRIIRHFIRVYSVCKDKNQSLRYESSIEISTSNPLNYKMGKIQIDGIRKKIVKEKLRICLTNIIYGQAHEILIFSDLRKNLSYTHILTHSVGLGV